METAVNRNMVAYDIGSHLGFFTILLAWCSKQAFAFEPNPMSFHRMNINLELNNMRNTVTNQVAVSDRSSYAYLNIARESYKKPSGRFDTLDELIPV